MSEKGPDDTKRQPELPPVPNDGAAAPADKSDTILPRTKTDVGDHAILIHDDAEHALRDMPDETVNEIATSTPYFRLRDYEVAGQIGRERSVQEYLERLWPVFDQARRVLTKDGICCVNLGDTSINGCLQMVPSRFALGMLDRGWILLNDLTWHKTNCKPESAKGRFTRDSESVYVFCKSKDHYFNLLFEPYRCKRDRRIIEVDDRCNPTRHENTDENPGRDATGLVVPPAKNMVVPGQTPHGMHRARLVGKGRDFYDPRGRRMRSVWSLPVARCLHAHFAVWPPELVRRLILAGCPPGGTVLDPFVGSGTTLALAIELHRRGIGIDLNAAFLEIARENVRRAWEKLKEVA